MFIVASWEDAIKLAKQIKDDLRLHPDNPAFTVSGGIAIVTPKFPIMKAAKDSEGEEGKAKIIAMRNRRKLNSFMSMPLNWEHEFLK